MTPASDGGFPSGHTNAFYLAGLAYAYAVPERFQEIVVRAMELANCSRSRTPRGPTPTRTRRGSGTSG